MKRRKLLYYALWPVEVFAFAVAGMGRALKWLLIASNPVLLALYLSRREKKRDRTSSH